MEKKERLSDELDELLNLAFSGGGEDAEYIEKQVSAFIDSFDEGDRTFMLGFLTGFSTCLDNYLYTKEHEG